MGVLSEIRKVFAETPESKTLGFQAGRFSFNVKGGRCEECKGYGYKKVEMHFLADVWVRCATCEGARFNRQTLAVTYKEKNIAEVLDMDVQEALTFFENHPKIRRILQTLHDVGLGLYQTGAVGANFERRRGPARQAGERTEPRGYGKDSLHPG